MAAAYKLELSPETRETLEAARDHHPKAYVRERATALLKVADGASIRRVAAFGCLKARRPNTVADWVKAYVTQGLATLWVQPGRGRKPAFSPSAHERRGGRPGAD